MRVLLIASCFTWQTKTSVERIWRRSVARRRELSWATGTRRRRMKGSRRPPLRVCPLQMVLPRRPYPLRSPSPRHDLHLRLHRALPHRRDRLLRARAAPIANGIASRPASRAPRRPPDQKENTREEEPSRQRSRHQMAHHRDPGACDAGGDCTLVQGTDEKVCRDACVERF